MATSTNQTASNPLSQSKPSIIACRRYHLEFPSKSQLFRHVKARPRYTRLKSVVSLVLPRVYPQHDTLSAPPQSGTSSGGGYYYNTISYTSSSSGNEYKQKVELKLQQHEKEHVESPQQEEDYVNNTHVFGHVQKDVQHYNQPYQDGVVKQNCEDQQKWQNHGNTSSINHGFNNSGYVDDGGYEDNACYENDYYDYYD